MKVKIYDCEEGNESLRRICELSEAFPDQDEYARAYGELVRTDRYWAGGGTAPLQLVMRVRGL
jgi:hypothetical protein